jgi:hypothetical protein
VDASVEEGDLEGALGDGARLADELVEPAWFSATACRCTVQSPARAQWLSRNRVGARIDVTRIQDRTIGGREVLGALVAEVVLG